MHFSQQHNWNSESVPTTQPTTDGNWLGATGPNGGLLKLPEAQLCTTCHDALGLPSPGTPGDPYHDVAMKPSSPSVGMTTMALSSAPAATPRSATTSHMLSCATCHTPHGGANFRNLRADPAKKGEKLKVVARVNEAAAKGVRAREAAYSSDNVVYESGMNEWCHSCHNGIKGHGQEAMSLSARPGGVLGESSLVNVGSWMKAVDHRVSVERPGGDAKPSPSDRVMCLTCHKAHGSGNRASLIFADGQTITSTCQQCHDE